MPNRPQWIDSSRSNRITPTTTRTVFHPNTHQNGPRRALEKVIGVRMGYNAMGPATGVGVWFVFRSHASIAPLPQHSAALNIASKSAIVAPQHHQALTITALGAVQALRNARCWPTTLHAATSFAPSQPTDSPPSTTQPWPNAKRVSYLRLLTTRQRCAFPNFGNR